MVSRVFVTDAQMRSSLAVIRSLGAKGIEVTAGEDTRFATGFFSKYCADTVVYPSPTKKRADFVAALVDILQSDEYDVLFPVADACLAPIIENERVLSKYTRIALPPRKTFLHGFDKGATLKIALEHGIPCPATFFVDTPRQLEAAKRGLDYPMVIKPRISSGRRGVAVCSDDNELVAKYSAIHAEYEKVLIQEFIPRKEEFGVYALLNDASELRAITVQRRLRSYPVDGGPSTLRETIRNESTGEAVRLARELLKAMNWTGVAMVEFRVDARDGVPKLMEVNPRYWGSLQLSILAGVDFPYLQYRMMMEGDVETAGDYLDGIKCRWLLPGDVLWFLSAPKKLENVREFVRFDTPDDIISRTDPGPTFGFFLATLRYAFDREMYRFVFRR
jgi:predicted ATP-grasp superfamily ATP-dependent carboligase